MHKRLSERGSSSSLALAWWMWSQLEPSPALPTHMYLARSWLWFFWDEIFFEGKLPSIEHGAFAVLGHALPRWAMLCHTAFCCALLCHIVPSCTVRMSCASMPRCCGSQGHQVMPAPPCVSLEGGWWGFFSRPPSQEGQRLNVHRFDLIPWAHSSTFQTFHFVDRDVSSDLFCYCV